MGSDVEAGRGPGSASSAAETKPDVHQASPEESKKADTSQQNEASTLHTSESNVTSSSGGPQERLKLRVEVISETQTKATIILAGASVAAGIILLILAVIANAILPDKWFLEKHRVEVVNSVVGIICLAALVACLGFFTHRIYDVRRHGLHLNRRRRIMCAVICLEAGTQLVNVSAFVAANLYVWTRECAWFDHFVKIMCGVQWSCWGTIFLLNVIEVHNKNLCTDLCEAYIRRKRLVEDPEMQEIMEEYDQANEFFVVDLPQLVVHWPKLVLWGAYQVSNVLTTVIYTRGRADKTVPSYPGQPCENLEYDCKASTRALIMALVEFALWLVFLVAWYYYLLRGCRELVGRSYQRFRGAIIGMRLLMKRRMWPAMMMGITPPLLFFMNPGRCSSFILSWGGLLPVHVVATATVVAGCYFYMPCNPKKISHDSLQEWLQEFSWTEAELPRRLAKRRRAMGVHEVVDMEPMFCFETSVKLYYWSLLTYQLTYTSQRRVSKEVADSRLKTAMSLYNLTKYELVREPAQDTVCLMAWSTTTVVLAFRGTASIVNVLADLQAWQTPHPPKRGTYWKRPSVHRGFLRSWQTNALGSTIVERVNEILCSGEINLDEVKVYITGHSLGGAIATLAAYDIAKTCACLLPMDVHCYTFGAPRTGNHAFAEEYLKAVPDTWHIINNQDVVARGGKFWRLYKRPGHRVIINAQGDIVVRPSFVEVSMLQRPFVSSFKEHFLHAYKAVFVAIIKAQFVDRKRIRDGIEGVLQLIESWDVRDLLSDAGLEVDALEGLSRLGATAVQLGGRMARDGRRFAEQVADSPRPEHGHRMQEQGGSEEEGASEEEPIGVDVEEGCLGPAGDDAGSEVQTTASYRICNERCRAAYMAYAKKLHARSFRSLSRLKVPRNSAQAARSYSGDVGAIHKEAAAVKAMAAAGAPAEMTTGNGTGNGMAAAGGGEADNCAADAMEAAGRANGTARHDHIAIELAPRSRSLDLSVVS